MAVRDEKIAEAMLHRVLARDYASQHRVVLVEGRHRTDLLGDVADAHNAYAHAIEVSVAAGLYGLSDEATEDEVLVLAKAETGGIARRIATVYVARYGNEQFKVTFEGVDADAFVFPETSHLDDIALGVTGLIKRHGIDAVRVTGGRDLWPALVDMLRRDGHTVLEEAPRKLDQPPVTIAGPGPAPARMKMAWQPMHTSEVRVQLGGCLMTTR